MKIGYKVFFAFILLGVALSVIFPHEIVWDFSNYHYYNGYAFLTGTTFYHLAPAYVNSYFNPLLEVPVYFIVLFFNNYPFVLSAYEGLWLGILYFIFFKILLLVFPSQTKLQKLGIVCAFVFGVIGYDLVSQIGSTTNEINMSVFYMGGLYFILSSWFKDQKPVVWKLMTGGFLLGVCAGLKMTAVPHVFALFLTCLICAKLIPSFWKSGLIVAGGLLIGFLITNGFWMMKLHEAFQNPVYPWLNALFQSDFVIKENVRENSYLPQSIWQYLFLPFGVFQVDGLYHHFDNKITLPLLISYLLVIFTLIGFCFRNFRQNIPNAKISFFLVVLTLWIYVVWLMTTTVVRYLIPFNLLSGIVLLVFLYGKQLLKSSDGFFSLGLFVIVFMFIPTQYRFYFKKADPSKIVSVEDPLIPDDAVVILDGRPTAFVIPQWQTKARFMQYDNSAFAGSILKEKGFQKELKKIFANPNQQVFIFGFLEALSYNPIIIRLNLSCKAIETSLFDRKVTPNLLKESPMSFFYLCPVNEQGELETLYVKDIPQDVLDYIIYQEEFIIDK